MTDEKLKQRCLELGYDEEFIDQCIHDTNIWAILIGERSGYFGRIFGHKYNNEKKLRNVLDNWDQLLVHAAINRDKKLHPEDYPEGEPIDDDELWISACSWGERGISDYELQEICKNAYKRIVEQRGYEEEKESDD